MSEKVLVFGGAGGIGAETARLLAKRGHAIHLVGRDESKLKRSAEESGACYSIADVEHPEAIERAVAEAGSPLSGLVYAVGTITLKPLGRLAPEDIERDLRVNAVGAALAAKAALPALKAAEGTGSIVFFSTVAVAQGFPAHASISMAKGAVEGLTVALAAEFAPKVRVNAIAPSLTRTQLARSFTGNEQMATAIAGLHALPRLGEAVDSAELAAFLISQNAGWITGQIIGVDGGRSTLRTKG